MKKVIAGYILGLACLFLFSLFFGTWVFSLHNPKAMTHSRVEKQNAPGVMSPVEGDYRRKKLRLSMSSFDLANGLTFKEIQDISRDPGFRLAAFLYLVASLWLVWGLRTSAGRTQAKKRPNIPGIMGFPRKAEKHEVPPFPPRHT